LTPEILNEMQKTRGWIQAAVMYLNEKELSDAYDAVYDLFIKSEGYQRFQDKLQASLLTAERTEK